MQTNSFDINEINPSSLSQLTRSQGVQIKILRSYAACRFFQITGLRKKAVNLATKVIRQAESKKAYFVAMDLCLYLSGHHYQNGNKRSGELYEKKYKSNLRSYRSESMIDLELREFLSLVYKSKTITPGTLAVLKRTNKRIASIKGLSPQTQYRRYLMLAYEKEAEYNWEGMIEVSKEAINYFVGIKEIEYRSQRLYFVSQLMGGYLGTRDYKSVIQYHKNTPPIDLSAPNQTNCLWRVQIALLNTGQYSEALAMGNKTIDQCRSEDLTHQVTIANQIAQLALGITEFDQLPQVKDKPTLGTTLMLISLWVTAIDAPYLISSDSIRNFIYRNQIIGSRAEFIFKLFLLVPYLTTTDTTRAKEVVSTEAKYLALLKDADAPCPIEAEPLQYEVMWSLIKKQVLSHR